MTLVSFGAGVLLGGAGLAVAALMEATYALLNPWGPVHPIVLASQVLGMTVVAAGGAAFGLMRGPHWPVVVRAPAMAGLGAVLTIIFDVLTNAATGLVFGQVRAMLIQGLPWMVGHLAWNAVIFAAIGTPLAGVFAHYRARLSSAY